MSPHSICGAESSPAERAGTLPTTCTREMQGCGREHRLDLALGAVRTATQDSRTEQSYCWRSLTRKEVQTGTRTDGTQVPAGWISSTSQKKYSTWNPDATPLNHQAAFVAGPPPTQVAPSSRKGQDFSPCRGHRPCPTSNVTAGECPSVSGCVPGMSRPSRAAGDARRS